MILRAVLVTMLFVGAGCFGECGPTLHRLTFTATFDGELTPANRSASRAALEAMGFSAEAGGPGGFFANRGDDSVFIENTTGVQPHVTRFQFYRLLENHEYRSIDAARADGYRQASAVWPAFNATLAAFEGRTNWTHVGDTSVEPQVYIC
jgi:hypothetical protein